MTLEKVADLLGVTPMSVSRHELGQVTPRPRIIRKYLAIYHGDVTRDGLDRFFEKAEKQRASVAPPNKETVT